MFYDLQLLYVISIKYDQLNICKAILMITFKTKRWINVLSLSLYNSHLIAYIMFLNIY